MTPPPTSATDPNLKDLKKELEEIKQLTGTYESYGFSPLTLRQVKTAFNNGIKNVLITVFGWFLTVLLLSVGAPFWQDTLESLFGIKNLLRKQSNTKNVEQQSGQGQTRP